MPMPKVGLWPGLPKMRSLLDCHFRSSTLQPCNLPVQLADEVENVVNALARHGMIAPDVVFIKTVDEPQLAFARFEPIGRLTVRGGVRIVGHANPPSFMAVFRRYAKKQSFSSVAHVYSAENDCFGTDADGSSDLISSAQLTPSQCHE